MTEAHPSDRAGETGHSIAVVALVGLVSSVGASCLWGLRVGGSVTLGGVIAVANLWIIAKTVKAFLSSSGRVAPFGLVLLLKMSALFGALFLLTRLGWIELLPFVVGFGALPLGIVLAPFVPSLRLQKES